MIAVVQWRESLGFYRKLQAWSQFVISGNYIVSPPHSHRNDSIPLDASKDLTSNYSHSLKLAILCSFICKKQ